MKHYVITFFSHYDALIFFKFLKESGTRAKLMPVPRKVSASCGTCVSLMAEREVNLDGYETEAVYLESDGAFIQI